MNSKTNYFDDVFFRLLGLGIRNQRELADILTLSQGTISDAKKRGVFPKKWVSILSQLYDKSPEWILGIEEESSLVQMEVSLVKSLVTDIAELKNQLSYMEGTISLLREEVDIMKALKHTNTSKKTGEDYSSQQEEATQEIQKKKVA